MTDVIVTHQSEVTDMTVATNVIAVTDGTVVIDSD